MSVFLYVCDNIYYLKCTNNGLCSVVGPIPEEERYLVDSFIHILLTPLFVSYL